MPPQETSPPPFDPEKFRTEFMDCLVPGKPVEAPIQLLNQALRANPDITDEICKIASTTFRAAAEQLRSPVGAETSHETEISPENQMRASFKEILHYILRRIKGDSFKRDMDQLGRKSPWAGMASWLIVEQCENGLGLRDKHMGNIAEFSTKLLIKDGADDTYGPYCGIQIALDGKPDSKLHGFIIVKLVRAGDEDIVEISSCSVDKFATVVGPTKDTIENHGGDYRIYNIGDINPDEWDVINNKPVAGET